ncbi:MAG: hypothetical protein R3336_02955 [Phycisphaeraceae bacterium]|nr:hypothetical protein [Phycisphaeraceae bacterium]
MSESAQPERHTQIACPACERALVVPVDAAGRRSRCPHCREIFEIPDRDQLLEHTVSSWLEEDVAPVIERRDRIEKQQPVIRPPRQVEWGGEVSGPRQVPDAEAQAPSVPEKDEVPPPTDQQLARETDSPALWVGDVASDGVEIAFDARWLAEPAFRQSMPMRCFVTGTQDPSSLRVRPLVFADRAGLEAADRRAMEREHEHHVLSNQSPPALAKIVGDLDDLEPPFHQPLLYYVISTYAQLCPEAMTTTENRSGGGITCRVLIIDAETALDWVGRVNGVCSRSYRALEEAVGEAHNEAWEALSDPTRLRIGGWMRFRPGERFVAYFNSAAFEEDDPGWAGLLVTDRRLVGHQYGRHEEVDLTTANGIVLIGEGEDGVEVLLEQNQETTWLGEIRPGDVGELVRALRPAKNLQIQQIG